MSKMYHSVRGEFDTENTKMYHTVRVTLLLNNTVYFKTVDVRHVEIFTSENQIQDGRAS